MWTAKPNQSVANTPGVQCLWRPASLRVHAITFHSSLSNSRHVLPYEICKTEARLPENIMNNKNLINPLSHTFSDSEKMSLPKHSAPYWSNPPFQFFDIQALWRSSWVPQCPNVKKLRRMG